jgi:hypothetical protein
VFTKILIVFVKDYIQVWLIDSYNSYYFLVFIAYEVNAFNFEIIKTKK